MIFLKENINDSLCILLYLKSIFICWKEWLIDREAMIDNTKLEIVRSSSLHFFTYRIIFRGLRISIRFYETRINAILEGFSYAMHLSVIRIQLTFNPRDKPVTVKRILDRITVVSNMQKMYESECGVIGIKINANQCQLMTRIFLWIYLIRR